MEVAIERVNILITSAGRRVSLLRSFQQALGERIPSAKVFTADACPELSAACAAADAAYSLPRLDEGSAYASSLAELCEEQRIGLVIPTIDTELLPLANLRSSFQEMGTELLVSDAGLIQTVRDKRLTHTFFERMGIPVPRLLDKGNPTFPLFIKPLDGSCSKDTYLISSAEALQSCFLEDDNLLFFEAIDRTIYDEFTCDLYYNSQGELLCVLPRKRLEVRAGEVNKALTVKNEIVPYLFEKLALLPGARGCITLQLFKHRHEATFFGIEVNARFGGGFPLSDRAGAKYPEWIVREYFLKEQLPRFDDWEDGLLMLRYDEEIFRKDFNSSNSPRDRKK